MNTEYVTYKQFDSMAKRIEKKNLKQYGRSLSFSGIARRAYSYIVELQDDHKCMIVKEGWREAMKKDDKISEASK
jgi:TFIIF-interacting CTD phosphatase-like protein